MINHERESFSHTLARCRHIDAMLWFPDFEVSEVGCGVLHALLPGLAANPSMIWRTSTSNETYALSSPLFQQLRGQGIEVGVISSFSHLSVKVSYGRQQNAKATL